MTARWTRLGLHLAYALLVGLVVLILLGPVGNADLWFHLATGDWMLAHGSIPSADPFAHTSAGRPLVVHGWLADLLFAQVRAQLGFGALRFVMLAAIGGGLLALFLLARAAGWSPALAAVLPVLVLWLFADRLRLRPDVFSFTGYPLLALGLLRWHAAGRLRCWPALATLGLVVLWVNLHPAVLLAPLLAGALWLGHRVWGDAEAPGLPWGAAPLLALATCLSPYGPRLYLYAVQVGDVGAFVSEWRSSLAYFLYEPPTRWPQGLAPFLIGALLLGSLRRPGPHRAWAFLGGLAWLYALLNGRYLYLLFWPLVLTWPASWRRPARAQAWALALGLAAAGGLVILRGTHVAHVLARPFASQRPGFPQGSAAFLRLLPRPVRLWHLSGWGAFLADQAPERARIFVDGRIVLFGRPLLQDQQALEARATPRAERERLLNAYGVEGLVWREAPDAWRPQAPWFRAYAEPVAAVYLHAERAPDLIEATLALYRRQGLDLPTDLDLPEAEARIAAFLALR